MNYQFNRIIHWQSSKRGIALVTALIFMLLVTIMAGAVLSITTKQARLAEHQVRRIKGFYAVESAMVKAYLSLRYADVTVSTPPVGSNWVDLGAGVWQWDWGPGGFEWRVDDAGNVLPDTKTIRVTYDTNTNQLTSTIDYGP
ncbi:MAG TPA: hypothetical protein ENH41_05875 [Candidatus Omnitrophica bacterium]|nr:hypothetical protein [Candidatus Omnitrophota bacterium]